MSVHGRATSTGELRDEEYEALLRSRDGLRRFLRWSERQAEAAGVTPAQHQLLLVVRAHGSPPTIGDVAEHLLLRHHSAVELTDRAEAAGLVRRTADRDDLRTVRLRLTPRGARTLAALSALHLEELRRLGGDLGLPWEGLSPAS